MKPAANDVSPEFARLVLPHMDAAYRLARWLLHDRDAAQDAVQDALVRAMTYFASFRGDNPRAWLLRIVRNAAWSRGGPKLDQLDADDGGAHQHLTAPGPDPEAALAQSQAHGRLSAAIARLPPDLRECLVLRELEEMSYRDIAEIAGVPVGTVMSRLFRARKLLIAIAQDTTR